MTEAPGTGRPSALIAATHLGVLLLLFAAQFVLPPFHHGMVARILVLGTFALGYNVLLGYTGLMSLGHATFFAAGIYGAGLPIFYARVDGPTALLLGVAGALLLSTVIGLITLRTGGVAFLIATMMFGQVFYLTTLHLNRYTGGDQGLILSGRLPALPIAGGLAYSAPAVKYNLALLVFGLSLLLSLWLVRSPIGRVLAAIRENEERAKMLGYNTFRYKLLALVISGMISGAAGAVYAMVFSYVGSTFASILYSILPLLWTLLGGAGTILGPLAGTAAMTYVVDVASSSTSAYLVVVGLVLVALTRWFPQGLVGILRQRGWRWLP